ncbi:MAG: ATP-binding protein [bacterium]|nr:ATP-binding protein [bacterium]
MSRRSHGPTSKSLRAGRRHPAASILKSFTLTFNPAGAVTAGFDAEVLAGLGDSGSIGDDLGDLLVAVGEAAQGQGTGLVFLLDEIQYLKSGELEALIAALHRCSRRALPVTLVGAGLPQMPRLAAEVKSYSERLFRFPTIGALDAGTHARDALTIPVAGYGVDWEPAAVDHVVDYAQGYPYFLQEYGKILWDETPATTITLDVARAVQPLVEMRLDESFFRVRVDRTTDLELRYLCAMAALGPKPHRAGDVARRLGRTTEQAGTIRSRLIDKGLLFTPGHGLAAFTVPQFDRYLLRSHARVLDHEEESDRPD